MPEQPVTLPFEVIAQIAHLAKAVAKANEKITTEHYFHLELRYPGDGRMGQIDGDFPDENFRFAWNPDEEDEPVMMPRPEDVSAGDPWIVEYVGHEWVGMRKNDGDPEGYSWSLTHMDGETDGYANDQDVTLISRLVPEVPNV